MVKMYLDVIACSYKENIDFSQLLTLPTYNSHKIGDIWHGKTALDYSEWSYNSDIFETRNIDFILRSFMNSIKDKQNIFIKRLKEIESELSIYVVVEKEKTDTLNCAIDKDLLSFYGCLNASISIDGLVDEVFDTDLTIDDIQHIQKPQTIKPIMSLDFNINSNEPIKFSDKKFDKLKVKNGNERNKYWCKITVPEIQCADTDELVKYFYKQLEHNGIKNEISLITESKNMVISVDNRDNACYSISFESKTINFLKKLNTNLSIDFKFTSNRGGGEE